MVRLSPLIWTPKCAHVLSSASRAIRKSLFSTSSGTTTPASVKDCGPSSISSPPMEKDLRSLAHQDHHGRYPPAMGSGPAPIQSPLRFCDLSAKSLKGVRRLQQHASALSRNRLCGPLPNQDETDGVWSTFFPVAKKGTDKLRGCIDLRTINPFLRYEHFKMEGTHTLASMLRRRDWMTKIDLSDFYMHLPIAEADRKFFRFMFNGIKYECVAMPFGLAPAPRIATKFLQPVIKYLRRRGVRCTVYIDDIIILARSRVQSLKHTQLAVDLLHSLGFGSTWTSSKECLGSQWSFWASKSTRSRCSSECLRQDSRSSSSNSFDSSSVSEGSAHRSSVRIPHRQDQLLARGSFGSSSAHLAAVAASLQSLQKGFGVGQAHGPLPSSNRRASVVAGGGQRVERQVGDPGQAPVHLEHRCLTLGLGWLLEAGRSQAAADGRGTVSYTHLTLPTILLV